jgi:hypothetical protein
MPPQRKRKKSQRLDGEKGMEFLAILLSSLIGLVSPLGIASERVAESTLRKQFVSVDELHVRIDNAPTYQLVQGKLDRLRIAGRGLVPQKEIRIDTLELETDPIALQGLRFKFAKPLQAGVRIVFKQDDINRALRSPTVTAQLHNLVRRNERYTLLNPNVAFLDKGRVRVQADLQEKGYADKLAIVAEADPKIIAGRTLQLQNLRVTANGQPVPDPIVQGLAKTVADWVDLRQLEQSGITARILNFDIRPNQLDLATFVQIRPTATRPASKRPTLAK